MKKTFLLGCSLSFLVTCTVARAEGWRLSGGPVTRSGMDLEISGSSHSQIDPTARLRASARSLGSSGRLLEASNDDISSYADRTFDDGFVFMDDSTVDYGGDTWYWGYQNDAQYDASADTLSFHRRQNLGSTSSTRELTYVDTVRDDRLSLKDELSGMGVSLTLERDVVVRKTWAASLAAGLVGLWGLESEQEEVTFEQDVRVVRETTTEERSAQSEYIYNLLNVVPPPAPYAGTHDGPGPLLPNQPASVQTVESSSLSTSRETVSAYHVANRVASDVEAAVYELWLGPRLVLHPGRRLSLVFTPYASLSLVDGQVDMTETLNAVHPNGTSENLAQWSDQACETDWLLGLGAQAGLRWNVSERCFLAASGGYDWVPSEYEVNVGPSQVRLNISGLQVAAEAGWNF